MRVVVVEDFKTMRRILISMLEQLGHEVVAEFTTIAEAMLGIAQLEPDLIVCDYTLGDGNGRDFFAQLAPATLENTNILIMGAESEKGQLQDCVKLGAKGYLTKPFTLNQLTDKIKKILTDRRAS